MKFRSLALFTILTGIASVGVWSCSSPGEKYFSSVIINNIDKTNETPKWVLNTKVLTESKGNVLFLHKINLDGSVRPNACLTSAKTQAVGEMMKYIKNSITASGQVEEISGTDDPSMSALTAFLSQGSVSGARINRVYWEQTMDQDKTTEAPPEKKLMCAVEASIKKSVLEKQMKQAINGAPGGNPEVRKKLLDAQQNFINNIGDESGK